VEVEVASEFRYRDPVLDRSTLVVAISQSGETADTLEAVRHAREQRARVLAICNTNGAQIPRESDAVLYTHAGPEVGVASTKSFLAQVTANLLVGLALAQARGTKYADEVAREFTSLAEMPDAVAQTLTLMDPVRELGREIAHAKAVLFLGRHVGFPVALEGALKLKELAYMHAEGFAAGELKHGPIALIDENMPVVVIAPFDRVFEKTVSNMQEVAARGGKIILMTDAKGAEEATVESLVTIIMPDMAATFTPLVYAIPVQLLAYHTAVIMGTDVDQPRNLAKSVTVE
jgi:glucosamine--fructose-6-phosphate aminotransferase (isomerizing)